MVGLPAVCDGELLLELDGPIHDVLRGFVDPSLERQCFDGVFNLFLLLDEYVHLVGGLTEQTLLDFIEDVGAGLTADPCNHIKSHDECCDKSESRRRVVIGLSSVVRSGHPYIGVVVEERAFRSVNKIFHLPEIDKMRG